MGTVDKLPLLGEYDVVVIGAGIIGAMIARELSRLQGRFALIEKEAFPGFGVSKASLSQIHLPNFCPPGSLKGRLSAGAPARFKSLSSELDVAYRAVDELWLAFEPSQVNDLQAGKMRGESHGSTGFEIIGPEKIRELEPYVTGKAVAALYSRGLGVIYPPEWIFALVEHAAQNGVHVHLGHEVTGVSGHPGASSAHWITTSKGVFRARYVVNAAGLYADDIAAMVGDRALKVNLRKGTMVVFDKNASRLARHMIYGTFSESHSQDIAPTAHGNLILGVHYVKTEDKEDSKVSREDITKTIESGKELIPALAEENIITAFSGIIGANTMTPNADFYIAPSSKAPGVMHILAGAPGLTAAPGIAEYIIRLLMDAGFKTEEKKDFKRERTGWFCFESASFEEKQGMISSDPKYGHVVCRCEHVTEAEITQAIQKGANTMDAVKHLTRAGMGRCQGGFCGISVLKQLASQLQIPPTQVTKRGAGSHQITRLTRTPGDRSQARC